MAYKSYRIPLAKSGLLSPLMSDYLTDAANLSKLYSHKPKVSEVAAQIAQKQIQPVNRKLLFSVLHKQYEGFEIHAATKANIDAILNEHTFTITTAHQPSLLLHPAYYAHKIAAAIATSKTLNQQLGAFHFVPLFWLGSEDHDFDELGKASFSGNEIVWETKAKGALGRFPLDGLEQVLLQLSELLGETHKGIIDVFKAGLIHTHTFGSYTRYVLNHLFGKYGLVILDQDDVDLKNNFKHIIREEIFNSVAKTVLEPSITFLQSQYKLQASPRDINFFHLGANYRERIIRNQQGFEVLNQSKHWSDSEMEEELNHYPENFSPNVIYRPLYQEFTLPNIAFVGGGAECSYWLQLKPLFDYFKVSYPLILHRPPMALLSSGVVKKMEKLNIEPASLFQLSDVFIGNYIEAHLPQDWNLEHSRIQMAGIFNEIAEKAVTIEPTLQQNIQAERQKALNQLEQLEARMLKAIKRKNETLVQQLKAIHEAVFPGGVFQERAESFLPNLADESFLDAIVDEANPFEECVVLLYEVQGN